MAMALIKARLDNVSPAFPHDLREDEEGRNFQTWHKG
jgi:hypothetical protein